MNKGVPPNTFIKDGNGAVPAGRQTQHGLSEGSDLQRDITEIRHIYRESYQDLLRYARGRLESLEMAQDVVQQAFANTLTSVERGARIRNVGGFLHRCVRNECLNQSRRESPLSLDEELCRLTEGSTVASAELKARWNEIEGFVDELKPSQRRAFILAEMRGFGYEEIARSMNRSVESVRSLLCRARQNVRSKANFSSDWLGCSIPALGLHRFPVLRSLGPSSNISLWIRNKVFGFQDWLGNNFQRGLDTLLQSSAAMLAGALVIAVATVSSPTPVDRGLQGTKPVASTPQKAGHAVSRPNSYTMPMQNPTQPEKGPVSSADDNPQGVRPNQERRSAVGRNDGRATSGNKITTASQMPDINKRTNHPHSGGYKIDLGGSDGDMNMGGSGDMIDRSSPDEPVNQSGSGEPVHKPPEAEAPSAQSPTDGKNETVVTPRSDPVETRGKEETAFQLAMPQIDRR